MVSSSNYNPSNYRHAEFYHQASISIFELYINGIHSMDYLVSNDLLLLTIRIFIWLNFTNGKVPFSKFYLENDWFPRRYLPNWHYYEFVLCFKLGSFSQVTKCWCFNACTFLEVKLIIFILPNIILARDA